MSVDLWRCQWICGKFSGLVEISVDRLRCQWTCGDFSGSVLEMSVDLSRCQWICGDVSGSVEMSKYLSGCQCDLWTCQDISVFFGSIEMSVLALDLWRCQCYL